MYLILIIAGTVALDQLVKHMVAGSMMLGQTIPVINNFFHITYIHNDGAAFGIMAGKAIFLIGLPALMMDSCSCPVSKKAGPAGAYRYSSDYGRRHRQSH